MRELQTVFIALQCYDFGEDQVTLDVAQIMERSRGSLSRAKVDISGLCLNQKHSPTKPEHLSPQ